MTYIDTYVRLDGRWSWMLVHSDGYIVKVGSKTYRWSWVARLAYYFVGWQED